MGRGAARAEDVQGTLTQSHISPSILVYEDKGSEPTPTGLSRDSGKRLMGVSGKRLEGSGFRIKGAKVTGQSWF